jgi:hypothetical protein
MKNSVASTTTIEGANTALPNRRSAHRNIGAASNSQIKARRYHKGWESQPASQTLPLGSTRGTIHPISLVGLKAVSARPVTALLMAITEITKAPKSQKGISNRRRRSRSTVRKSRRSNDAPSSDPATKNIVGIDATTNESIGEPNACQTTTRIVAMARIVSRNPSRGVGVGGFGP